MIGSLYSYLSSLSNSSLYQMIFYQRFLGQTELDNLADLKELMAYLHNGKNALVLTNLCQAKTNF